MTILLSSVSTVLVTATKNDYIAISTELSISLNNSKNQNDIVIDLLDIEVNTNSMITRLSDSKKTKTIKLVTAVLEKDVVSLHHMQQITGLLNFCSQVVHLDHTRMRRLYDFEASFWTRGERNLSPAVH